MNFNQCKARLYFFQKLSINCPNIENYDIFDDDEKEEIHIKQCKLALLCTYIRKKITCGRILIRIRIRINMMPVHNTAKKNV
jgi:hypothetical protein